MNQKIQVVLSLLALLFSNYGLGQEGKGNAKQRCDTRLSISFLGQLESAPNLTTAQQVDNFLVSPAFIEKFARFLNAKFNDEPGESSAEDAVYHLAKHILTNKEPYKNLFVGPYNVLEQGEGETATVVIQPDPNGLGYFSSPAWMARYAGNEETGLRIVAAYRIINNVLGAKLNPTTNAPDDDVSATGRAAPGCKSCHFENWFALDPLAEALSRVERDADNNITQFIPVDGTPKKVLGEEMVASEKELVERMVESDEFAFNSCRMSFQFLYGRPENSCEAKLFDSCMANFKKTGLIQDALATIAKDKSFCQ